MDLGASKEVAELGLVLGPVEVVLARVLAGGDEDDGLVESGQSFQPLLALLDPCTQILNPLVLLAMLAVAWLRVWKLKRIWSLASFSWMSYTGRFRLFAVMAL
jgi:hypothetical protein